MEERFSERVRAAARKLKEFTVRELAGEIGALDYREKRLVSTYVRDFILRGEMERVNPEGPAKRAVNGKPCEERYRYIYKAPRTTNRQRLWNVVRRMPSPPHSLC